MALVWRRLAGSATLLFGTLCLLADLLTSGAVNPASTRNLSSAPSGTAENAASEVLASTHDSDLLCALTKASGHVPLEVPRDREGTFEPQIAKQRQRRLNGVDEIVLSLYAKGLTTGEISAHFAEIYGASVSKETISRITDKVLKEIQDGA